MRDSSIALSLKYYVFIYYGFRLFYLLATIFFFRMDNIRVCVIYELGMIVWFVLYNEMDLG